MKEQDWACSLRTRRNFTFSNILGLATNIDYSFLHEGSRSIIATRAWLRWRNSDSCSSTCYCCRQATQLCAPVSWHSCAFGQILWAEVAGVFPNSKPHFSFSVWLCLVVLKFSKTGSADSSRLPAHSQLFCYLFKKFYTSTQSFDSTGFKSFFIFFSVLGLVLSEKDIEIWLGGGRHLQTSK